ncbi:MAG: SDR family oxidoreductase [Polyangiales bacterium]|nr:SDR family oxidoreductase [Myxococcales bacterium]
MSEPRASTLDRFRLDRKVAVVTGGSRGIGRAIARSFAEAGATVVIASRNAAHVMATAEEIHREHREAYGIPCDVSDPKALDHLFERVAEMCGGTDVFVHAAGVSSVGFAQDAPRDELQRMLDVHYLAGVRGAQLACAQMRERGGGSIVLVSSVWGLGGATASLAYGSAKAALAHAVKVMGIEWARYGVRANALAPGFVDTDMTDEMDAKTRDKLVARVPMRRMASPDEMAGPALFLASGASSYMTGQVLVADGGERAR